MPIPRNGLAPLTAGQLTSRSKIVQCVVESATRRVQLVERFDRDVLGPMRRTRRRWSDRIG
jgi:hypothetical protein